MSRHLVLGKCWTQRRWFGWLLAQLRTVSWVARLGSLVRRETARMPWRPWALVARDGKTSEKTLSLSGFFFFFWYIFLAVPPSMWDLSSPARDCTCIPRIGSIVLTTESPGNSHYDKSDFVFYLISMVPRVPAETTSQLSNPAVFVLTVILWISNTSCLLPGLVGFGLLVWSQN